PRPCAGRLMLRFFAAALCVLALLTLPGCRRHAARAAAPASAGIRFTDVAGRAGVRFKHTSGASGRLLLPETLGSGCAIFDYDADGRPDLFLVNGTRLPGYPGRGPFYSALYRNLGPGPDGFPTFQDVTQQARLAVD